MEWQIKEIFSIFSLQLLWFKTLESLWESKVAVINFPSSLFNVSMLILRTCDIQHKVQMLDYIENALDEQINQTHEKLNYNRYNKNKSYKIQPWQCAVCILLLIPLCSIQTWFHLFFSLYFITTQPHNSNPTV